MSRVVSFRRDRGFNGVLLAAVLAGLRSSRLRIWTNNISDGHYGYPTPSLEGIRALAKPILAEIRQRALTRLREGTDLGWMPARSRDDLYRS
jgi:hypothetical protein